MADRATLDEIAAGDESHVGHPVDHAASGHRFLEVVRELVDLLDDVLARFDDTAGNRD